MAKPTLQMLLALIQFISFNEKDSESVGQWFAKLPAIKL